MVFNYLNLCGENRIRTCEPVSPVTRFPGVPLQPLEHLSINSLRMIGQRICTLFARFSEFALQNYALSFK